MRTERDAEVEQVVLEAVREVAGRPAALDDRLADLGLDSLRAAELALLLEERLGVDVSGTETGVVVTVRDVFDAVRAEGAARSPLPPTFARLNRAAAAIVAPPLRWYGRLEVVGAEHVPPSGAVIVAPNHRSMLDVPAVVVACPRRLLFIAKQELFALAPLRALWRELGAFPVRRDVPDLRAIGAALALLRRGEAVGIYPEGTRNPRTDLLPFLHGAAWLALRTGAPVVPCGVTGTGTPAPYWRRRRVRVAFGAPIAVAAERDREARRERSRALTVELARAVRDLLAP